jgi:hypothetical protein
MSDKRDSVALHVSRKPSARPPPCQHRNADPSRRSSRLFRGDQDRRALITTAAGLLAAPLTAEAQLSGKVPRIGLLDAGSLAARASLWNAFRQGMRGTSRAGPWSSTAKRLGLSIPQSVLVRAESRDAGGGPGARGSRRRRRLRESRGTRRGLCRDGPRESRGPAPASKRSDVRGAPAPGRAGRGSIGSDRERRARVRRGRRVGCVRTQSSGPVPPRGG